MFWGCFSYDKKGPFHIWKKETNRERQAAQVYLDAINASNEPAVKTAWELQTAMRRLNLRRRPAGRIPVSVGVNKVLVEAHLADIY